MLLNSPIFEEALQLSSTKAKRLVENICDRVKFLDAHTALFILCNYTAAPRFSYLLRSSPLYRDKQLLQSIDNLVRDTLSATTNVSLDEPAWKQATLPVWYGGIGVRSVETLSLPCFIASTIKSSGLVDKIMGPDSSQTTPLLDSAIIHLKSKHRNIVIPNGDAASKQRSWDEAVCKLEYNNLLCSADQISSARLRAAAEPHSGAWLQALPSPALGLHLNEDTVRISVCLRLGAPICEPHRCRCGQTVSRLGHHGLSCQQSNRAGRLPRHYALNDSQALTIVCWYPFLARAIGLGQEGWEAS